MKFLSFGYPLLFLRLVITPEEPYTNDYDELLDIVQAEQREAARPAISGTIENFDSYDVIYFYDTAIVYQNGTSEQYVGRALRDFAKRDDYVIATKFTPWTQEELDTGISGRQHIENYLNRSLKNLSMEPASRSWLASAVSP